MICNDRFAMAFVYLFLVNDRFISDIVLWTNRILVLQMDKREELQLEWSIGAASTIYVQGQKSQANDRLFGIFITNTIDVYSLTH